MLIRRPACNLFMLPPNEIAIILHGIISFIIFFHIFKKIEIMKSSKFDQLTKAQAKLDEFIRENDLKDITFKYKLHMKAVRRKVPIPPVLLNANNLFKK